MEYEALFLQYKEEFIEANEKLSFRKIYKTILKKIRYLFFAIKTEKKTTIRNRKTLENMYPLNERPLGFNRKILVHSQKETMLDSYLILVEAFVSVLIDYYKNGNLRKDIFVILESLLEITSDAYIKEQENYEAYFQRVEMSIVNQEIPSLEQIDMYNDLVRFINQVLCNYEEFNFTKFQRELIKK